MLALTVITTVAALASAGGAGYLWTRLARLRRQIPALPVAAEGTGDGGLAPSGDLRQRLADAEADCKSKEELLDTLEQENEFLRHELEKRPQMTRRVYRILTLGISGTGKTALTLKWANPLFDLGLLKGTKIERYERTVSQVAHKDVLTEHVFEVGDWGGEHIVDALQEAMTEEVHGMLIVVDLAAPSGPAGSPKSPQKGVDPERIQRQLKEFQPEVLRFFFGPRTVTSCKTVVLFINKSDVLSGTPQEIERVACAHYQRLIQDLEPYREKIDVRVLVGSATSGHSTHHLFSHFVDRILPRNAFDGQLLQRMMADDPAGGPDASRE
jgi:hypothetical protein